MLQAMKHWVGKKVRNMFGITELINYTSAIATHLDALAAHQNRVKTDPYQIIMEKAAREAADYIEKHPSSMVYPCMQRTGHLSFALSQAPSDGLFLEFGVCMGNSINHFASQRQDTIFHGFDSFEGLPEDWLGHMSPKGTFSIGGTLPNVAKNVVLHKGWFDQTLPEFLAQRKNEKIAFMHIDSDIYSSAKTILDCLGNHIIPGTVIVFDEYYYYNNWREHEYKAFAEFVKRANAEYRYISFCEHSAAIIIDNMGEGN